MSIQQLRPPVVAGAVAAVQDRVREAAAVSVGSVSTNELGEVIAALSDLESQVVALRLSLSVEADTETRVVVRHPLLYRQLLRDMACVR